MAKEAWMGDVLLITGTARANVSRYAVEVPQVSYTLEGED